MGKSAPRSEKRGASECSYFDPIRDTFCPYCIDVLVQGSVPTGEGVMVAYFSFQ